MDIGLGLQPTGRLFWEVSTRWTGAKLLYTGGPSFGDPYAPNSFSGDWPLASGRYPASWQMWRGFWRPTKYSGVQASKGLQVRLENEVRSWLRGLPISGSRGLRQIFPLSCIILSEVTSILYEPLFKLLVYPLVTPVMVPYTTPFEEFRLYLILQVTGTWLIGPSRLTLGTIWCRHVGAQHFQLPSFLYLVVSQNKGTPNIDPKIL